MVLWASGVLVYDPLIHSSHERDTGCRRRRRTMACSLQCFARCSAASRRRRRLPTVELPRFACVCRVAARSPDRSKHGEAADATGRGAAQHFAIKLRQAVGRCDHSARQQSRFASKAAMASERWHAADLMCSSTFIVGEGGARRSQQGPARHPTTPRHHFVLTLFPIPK
jgi:hypothetical protein